MMNMTVKARKKSNRENTMKMIVHKYNVTIEMTLALSAEYANVGSIASGRPVLRKRSIPPAMANARRLSNVLAKQPISKP